MEAQPATQDNLVNSGSSVLPRILPIDVEHGGIRLALPFLTLAGLIVGYWVTTLILQAISAELASGCLGFIGAIATALASAVLGDYILKRIWPSGRRIVIKTDEIVLEDHRKGHGKDVHMQWDQRINPILWRFKVSRGSARVPKGWIMLGLKLVQDDDDATVYTFMPEKEAAKLSLYSRFTPLVSRIELESDKLPLKEKTEQRRLLKAEQDRWADGGELRREDFPYLVSSLAQHITEW